MIIHSIYLAALLAGQDSPPYKVLNKQFDKIYAELSEPAQMFVLTCVSRHIALNDFENLLKDKRFEQVAPDQAKRYLFGKEGRVWAFRGIKSNYLLKMTNDNRCEIIAQHADRAAAMSDLKHVFELFYPYRESEKLPDDYVGSNNDRSASEGRAVFDPKRNRTIIMAVTTPKFNNPPFEAVFTAFTKEGPSR